MVIAALRNTHRTHRTHTTHRTHRTHPRHALTFALPVVLLAACLAGCATHRERLPSWEPAPPDETWRALRAHATGDITASGEVTLWTDRGRATLDCAIASSAAGDFRLRAWKLDQAALDITLTGGDLYVYAPQSAPTSAPTSRGDLEQIRAADIAQAWRLVSGAIFEQAPPEAEHSPGVYRYTDADGVRITVHRVTRTARRFELPEATPPLTLDLDRFELIDGRPWPTRLELRAGDRRARITLQEIEFAPPPPGAFTPPRRAERVEQP